MISQELLLLKLIDVNGSLSPLRDRGLSNSQIALLLKKQVELGNLVVNRSGVKLTNTGREVLTSGFNELKYKPKDSWILPQEKYYNKPISEKKIVLPKKYSIL